MPLTFNHLQKFTGHNGAIYSLDNGSESGLFYSGGGDGWLVEWNPGVSQDGRLIAQTGVKIFSLCVVPDQEKIFIGNMDGGIHEINQKNGTNTANIAHHSKGLFSIIWKDQQLYTLGGEGKFTRWKTSPLKPEFTIQLSNSALRCADFCPRRNEWAIGASDGNIYLLDGENLTPKTTIPNAHQNSVFAIRYHPEKPYLISGGRDAHLNVFELETQEKMVSLPAHWFTINSIAFSPTLPYFATASRDKTVKIWDTDEFNLLKVLEGYHFNSVNSLLWTKNGDQLLTAGDDRVINFFKFYKN